MTRQERNRQLITGIVMLLVTVPFILSSKLSSDGLYLLPNIALVIMAVSSAVLILKALLAKPRETDEGKAEKQDDRAADQGHAGVSAAEILGCFVFLFSAVLLMDVLGTYVTLFIVLFVSHLYVCHRKKNLSVIRSLVFALIAIAVVVGVFHFMLGLRVPRGILF